MRIISKNIILQSANFSEIEKLNNIYDEACDYFSFDKNNKITKPLDCLTVGDLPPNGTKDNYEILSIYEGNNIIGVITLYKGFPSERIMYISFIYISKENRYRGYGKEIFDALSEYFKKEEFEDIRICVSLKNWKGIKFWYKCGFNKITLVNVEEGFSENNYGCIELEKSIY